MDTYFLFEASSGWEDNKLFLDERDAMRFLVNSSGDDEPRHGGNHNWELSLVQPGNKYDAETLKKATRSEDGSVATENIKWQAGGNRDCLWSMTVRDESGSRYNAIVEYKRTICRYL
jgi:hypothetical protein